MEQLKLIPGKDYRMRNGEKAKFMGMTPNDRNVFYHYIDEDIYNYNGSNFDLDDDNETEWDIISEWEEPREPRVWWVNEYKNVSGNIFYGSAWESEEDCKRNAPETVNYIRTIKLQEVIE